MKNIRKGDEVIVITGKDKSRKGLVLAVHGDRVTVEGINVAKKAVKPNPDKGIAGGIEAKLMPIHISNIALVDEQGKPSRVRIVMNPEGKKQRVLKTTGQVLAKL